MAGTPIVFPTSSGPGARPQESAGRLINAFYTKTLKGSPSDTAYRRSPGLTRVMEASYLHTRGFLQISLTEAFWILTERVVKFNQGFIVTADLGVLAGEGPVTTARNNALPHDHVVVTDNGCYNLLVNAQATAFASPNLPANPTSVCDFDGYFIWSFGDGRVFASDLNSVNVDALSFTTEQGLFARRVVQYAGSLFVFGDKWTGVYRDAGTQPFPLAREVTIPRGIIGTHAIAGWESGWANDLIWVGDDFVVYQLGGGYSPSPISTDDVSRDIKRTTLEGNRNNIEAFVYMYEKNPFWVVTFAGEWTWEYNLATGEWNERRTVEREEWKGHRSIRMFDSWLIGDRYSGELYKIDGNSFTEGDDLLIWQVESGTMTTFPQGMVIPRASFNMTTGVGDYPDNFDPKVEISWSLDGGYTYGDPVIRRLGGPGRTVSHPYVLNSGLSRGQGLRYRLRVSDPVHVHLSGGIIDAEQRAYSG